jgi:hypothetical protein
VLRKHAQQKFTPGLGERRGNSIELRCQRSQVGALGDHPDQATQVPVRTPKPHEERTVNAVLCNP